MPSWQDIVALALVGLAAGFVVRSIWRTLRGSPGMGCPRGDRCPGCGGGISAPTTALDTLQPGEQNCERR